MLKPASKKQALIFALTWTALTIYYFTCLFRPNLDGFYVFMVIACTVNAGGWWTNYAKKRLEENEHE